MSTIVTRAGKGSPLTNNEVDANFTNLNTDKVQVTGTPTIGQAIVWNGSAWIPGASATYPAAGVAVSTGSAWNGSLSTSGSGTVLALTTGASLTHPTITDYQAFTSASNPTFVEGLMWYDGTRHSLAYYNDVSTAIVHIGQDLQVKVINNTGSTIANGAPVYITGTSSGQTYPNVALAKADVAGTSAVIGLTNGSIANGAVGYVTATGGIDGVNTGAFTVGQVLYLSPYSAGQLMNTIPPTGITVQVGVVSYVDSTNGKIYVKQTTPLAVPASIITGTLPIANGGTGSTTAQGAINTLSGAVTSGSYLRGNGTNVVMSAIQAADVPTLNQNTTGTAANITATSNSTLTTLSALSLPYSQLSGTVPTWNQNTTGTAANVTGIVASSNGGTGVNNGSATLTLAGNVTYSGAFTQTIAATANTSITLPTSGTLVSSVTALPGAVTGTPSSTTYLRGDGTWATVTAGVSQIIAGTNVTISPAGGTGAVTINATGGGGGSSTTAQAYAWFISR